MDTFNFPMHTPTHFYPKGDAVKFGKGYVFNTKPQLPFQRTFRLTFNSMVWYLQGDGSADLTTNPTYNMQVLVNFFEAHDYSQAFIYPHPVYGNLTVKFAADQAFEIPKSLPGGSGATEPFDIYLIEQPGL